MNRLTCPLRLVRAALALLGLTLLVPGIAQAQATYKMQPILKIGDTVNGFAITPGYVLYAGPLNDRGQLAIGVGTNAGGKPELLLQYANGQLTTIGGPGLDAPGGKFPANVTFYWPFSMNQFGNIVFAGAHNAGTTDTFLWDNQAKKLTAVALTGMPAVNNLTFQTGGYDSPAINNFGDIVFPAKVRNAAGEPALGLFFLGRDGKLLPIVLPDQELPDGQPLAVQQDALLPSLNDAGIVAFLAVSKGNSRPSAYLWEQGSISPLVTIGMTAPGNAQPFKNIVGAWVNNSNRNVLVAARIGVDNAPTRLYLWSEGKLSPVLVQSQLMPGGGRYNNLLNGYFGMSVANDAGEHVFEAGLTDGSQAAYLLEPDGKLSLILKSEMSTDLGPLTRFVAVGSDSRSLGISLNNKGQIAMVVEIGSNPDVVVLLTPTTP